MNKQPNIIFMLTDDQRYDTFGFMGNEHICTPNLDKMANDGVYFNEAFHVAPICMPSRASIQLGQYILEHRCGFDYPTNYTISKEEYKKSYPVLLRENGYYTGFIGKFGFGVTENKVKDYEDRLEYVQATGEPIYWSYNNHSDREDCVPKEEFDVWNGFPKQGKYFPEDGMFNGHANPENCEHLTDFNTYQAKEFFRKAKESEKPFALSISYKAPHGPFTPSEKWKEYYKDADIPRAFNDKPEYFAVLPKVVREHSRNAEQYWGRYTKQLDNDRPWKEDKYYKQDAKDYYALISGVDESVGEIRKELEKLGVAENTVLIFTSDNGYFLGSKQIGGKELLYEESIRAPFIVYDPRLSEEKQGRSIDGMISMIDVYSTILDYAGVKKPDKCYGESIIPLINLEKDEIHDAVYGENDFDNNYLPIDHVEDKENYQSIRSKYVRTKEYKFIRYHECHPIVEELLAIDKDPLEVNNLINNPEYKEVADKMRNMLNEFETWGMK